MTSRGGGPAAFALTVLLPIVLAATGCTEDPSTLTVNESIADVTVKVAGMAYSPASVTIDVGQSVAWHFADRGIGHTVVGRGAASTLLHSPMLGYGDYVQTFDEPGTYLYYCTLHPQMKAAVVVR